MIVQQPPHALLLEESAAVVGVAGGGGSMKSVGSSGWSLGSDPMSPRLINPSGEELGPSGLRAVTERDVATGQMGPMTAAFSPRASTAKKTNCIYVVVLVG